VNVLEGLTMSILFKTYNRKHQLHIYNETWALPDKKYLDELLTFLSKDEATKVKVLPSETKIEIELNAIIINCAGLDDLKKKFGILAEMKERFQKVVIQKSKKDAAKS